MMSILMFVRSNHIPGIVDIAKQLEHDRFKIVVSGYGDAELAWDHYFKGGKWTGVFDYFSKNKEILDEYDYFWFPDDDIETSEDSLKTFFAIVAERRLELAQPALTANSYYADRITLANPNFTFRWTNFVELMMPMMSRALFKRLLPLLEGRHAGLGLDFFWHQLADAPDKSVGIIDATPMAHLRPRRVHLKKSLEKMAVDLSDERTRTFAELSIKRQRPVNLAAQLHSGEIIDRGSKLFWLYLDGVLKIKPATSNQPLTSAGILRLMKDQIFSRPERRAYDPVAVERILAPGN